jgi:hypothetical protein
MNSIKNWHKFQHFKDRKPPWVKLYRDLLDDIDWHELDPKAAKVLVMLWLIASEEDGKIPEVKRLAFRLRMSEKDTEVCISKLSHWLDQDDINPISEGYQDDPLETEKETETKKEIEKEKKATGVACPPTVDPQVWSDWLQIRKAKKLPMTETAWSQIQNEFRKSNLSDQQGVEYCCLSNWASFKTAWYEKNQQEQSGGLTKQGQTNQRVLSGLTRGLIQGDSNVRLLGK